MEELMAIKAKAAFLMGQVVTYCKEDEWVTIKFIAKEIGFSPSHISSIIRCYSCRYGLEVRSGVGVRLKAKT
jgi:hypothetical protein